MVVLSVPTENVLKGTASGSDISVVLKFPNGAGFQEDIDYVPIVSWKNH